MQTALSHVDDVLSPVVRLHVAPLWQRMLHEGPHVPLHDVPEPQSIDWLPPLGIVHAKPLEHTVAPPVDAQPGPGHADVVPVLLVQPATTKRDARTSTDGAMRMDAS